MTATAELRTYVKLQNWGSGSAAVCPTLLLWGQWEAEVATETRLTRVLIPLLPGKAKPQTMRPTALAKSLEYHRRRASLLLH